MLGEMKNRAGMTGLEQAGGRLQSLSGEVLVGQVPRLPFGQSVPLAGGVCCLQLVTPTLAAPRPPVTHFQEKEDTRFLPVLGVNKAQREWERAESGQRMGYPWKWEVSPGKAPTGTEWEARECSKTGGGALGTHGRGLGLRTGLPCPWRPCLAVPLSWLWSLRTQPRDRLPCPHVGDPLGPWV